MRGHAMINVDTLDNDDFDVQTNMTAGRSFRELDLRHGVEMNGGT